MRTRTRIQLDPPERVANFQCGEYRRVDGVLGMVVTISRHGRWLELEEPHPEERDAWAWAADQAPVG